MKDNESMKRITVILIMLIAFTAHAAPLEVGIYDDTSLILTYSGTWSSTASGFAFGNSYQSTTSASSAVSFETYTDGFTVYFVSDPAYGSMDVCIDGTCTSVSQTANTARASASFTSLGVGQKDVVIQKTADDGTAISFDAVYNHPGGEGVNANIIESSFSFDGTDYIGLYDLRITAGDAALVILLVFIGIMQVVHLVWMVRK